MSIIRPKSHGAKQRKGEYRQSDPTGHAASRAIEEHKVYFEPEERVSFTVLEDRGFALSEVLIKENPKFTKREVDVLRSLLLPGNNAKPNMALTEQMEKKHLLAYIFLPDMLIVYDPVGMFEDLTAEAVLWQFKKNGRDIVQQPPMIPFSEGDELEYALSRYFANVVPGGGPGVIQLKQDLEEWQKTGSKHCYGQIIPFDMVRAKIEARLVFVLDRLP